jgi:acid phosphatase type 7
MTTRRTFLRNAALAGAGAALAGPWGLSGRALAQDTGSLPADLAAGMPTYLQPGVPRGTRLSFTSDDLSRRTATWLTTDHDTASLIRWAKVGASTRPEDVDGDRDLQLVQRGSSARAPFGEGNRSDFLEPIRDNGEPREGEREVFVHRATMSDLRPGERIAYQVGGDGRWSDIAITAGGPLVDEGFRFTHFGDQGTGPGGLRATAALQDLATDWHIIAGDISYADGDQRKWDLWAEQFAPFGSQVPLMTVPGNHENKDFMGQAYRTRFAMPGTGAPFYSFVYGNVFLVSTAAGAFFGDREAALEDIRFELIWMEHTLARAAAMRAAGLIDFIVVTQHFPSFTDTRNRGPISPDRVVAAEQILQRYQIDLLLVGHDHMYQRSHPMAYGIPTVAGAYTDTPAPVIGAPLAGPKQERYSNATGYIEVIAGSGGKSLYEFTEVDTLDLAIDPDHPQQRSAAWLAAAAREQCVVTYDVRGEEMEITGMIFPDGNDENVGDGIPDNAPGEPGDRDENGNRRPIRFDPDARPEAFDRFTLVRKAYAEEVPTTPRPNAVVLGDIPEAHGVLNYNLDEDCTLHDH